MELADFIQTFDSALTADFCERLVRGFEDNVEK